MARAGRKRKLGLPREPNGRASRKAARKRDQELFRDFRLGRISTALNSDQVSPVLMILRQFHPIGEMVRKGEITELEFVAAMIYFASIFDGPRLDHLRAELETEYRLDLSDSGRNFFKYAAFCPSQIYRLTGESLSFDAERRLLRAGVVTDAAIRNAKLPDSPADYADFLFGLKVMPITFGIQKTA